jgi:hypothetical protein
MVNISKKKVNKQNLLHQTKQKLNQTMYNNYILLDYIKKKGLYDDFMHFINHDKPKVEVEIEAITPDENIVEKKEEPKIVKKETVKKTANKTTVKKTNTSNKKAVKKPIE